MTQISKTCLKYFEYGDPAEVIKKCEEPLRPLTENEVLVRIMAAPINPSDLLTIKGWYPSRPDLPAIPGNECVGQVVATGAAVTKIKAGDYVVPLTDKLGTWSSHLITSGDLLRVIPPNIPMLDAATITVNPCTAYRLLTDFVKLEPGDVVIQNGANSACGKLVIQLAKMWGVKTINVVRDRPDIDSLKSCLKEYGATEVLTEEELQNNKSKLSKPKLAFDCVGANSAREMIKQLDHGGTLVTYGVLSGQPLQVDASDLIFRDVKVRGYWMTEWTKKNFSSTKRSEMFDKLFAYLKEGKLRGPEFKVIYIDDYKNAFVEMASGAKCVLVFDKQLMK